MQKIKEKINFVVAKGVIKWSDSVLKTDNSKDREKFQKHRKLFVVEKLRLMADGLLGVTRSEGCL